MSKSWLPSLFRKQRPPDQPVEQHPEHSEKSEHLQVSATYAVVALGVFALAFAGAADIAVLLIGHPISDAILAGCGVIGAASGIFVARFTQQLADTNEKMWVTTRAAADAAQASADFLKMSERAWMGWSTVQWVRFERATIKLDEHRTVTDASGVAFAIEWINAGKTPAIKVNLFGGGLLVPSNGDIPTFTRESINQIQATIVPGMKVAGFSKPFTDIEIAAVKARASKIFLYGAAVYETVFVNDTVKETEVCMEATYSGDDATGAPQFSFTPRGPNNTAT